MRAAFASLERAWGDPRALVHTGARVLERTALDKEAIQELVSHRALAVHVRNWFKRPREVASRILADEDVRNWSVSHGHGAAEDSDVDAVGLPHNVATASGREQEYFAGAIAQTRKWRAGGQLGPMDQFRLEMDEVWPDGCVLSKDKASGSPYMAGIPRIMRPPAKFDPARWTRGFAHVDELDLMRTDRGLYSANVYLRNAPSGGELHIWPITFTSRFAFYRNAMTLSMCLTQDAAAQAALRERLPPPVTIRVQEGDLVLLCTQRPHAVKGPIVGGTRVSMQGFIQFETGKPLRLEA